MYLRLLVHKALADKARQPKAQVHNVGVGRGDFALWTT